MLAIDEKQIDKQFESDKIIGWQVRTCHREGGYRMQFFVLVLNREECLEPILEGMLEAGFSGATILNSTGMMRVLDGDDNVDLPMLGLLRHFYSPERKTSKTLFTLIDDDKRDQVMKIINEKTGGLNKPDTGIAFSLPVSFVEGVRKEA